MLMHCLSSENNPKAIICGQVGSKNGILKCLRRGASRVEELLWVLSDDLSANKLQAEAVHSVA